jgi:hypothetical protein
MNIREISDVFKDTANQITAIKSYNFGWASDRTRSTNTEDYQELNEFPRVFFSVPTITGSDQTRKQDTYQVTLFFDDLLGYNNEGDADLTLQIDKWAALQEYANYFVQRLNKVKQSILPNYLFIPEAPSITFDSFTGLQRMITVQLSFTLVVPTNCEPVVSKLVECIANIVTSSNLTAALKNIFELASTLQASSSLSANLQLTKFAASSLNTASSLAASALVSKLAASSLTGAGTLAADLTVTSGSAFDADAQAFFDRVTTAGGTLTDTEKTAVNTLVVGMKADGIWTKMKAIYPMVGGGAANPAAACRQNLKSSSFTGTFSSGWTFASTGVTPNGTSSFMDTLLNARNTLTFANTHISIYSRTNVIVNANSIGVSQGESNSFLPIYALALRVLDIIAYIQFDAYDYNNHRMKILNPSSLGFYIGNILSTTSQKLYKNGDTFGTITIPQTQTQLPNYNFWLGTRNDADTAAAFDSKQYAFASIGDGLTDTDAANFYTRVQAFQTTLSRQV